MKKKLTSKEFLEFKEAMQRELNAEEYPFVVTVSKNKVVAKWKAEQAPEGDDSKEIESFSVTYIVSRDKRFYGGETLLVRNTYQVPTSTEVRTVYSLSTPKDLRWKKKVNSKDWAKIGFNEDKLMSIIEYYLLEHGFSYRPGIWNHKRLNWVEGRQFRVAGISFLFVGIMLLIGFLNSSIISDCMGLEAFFAVAVLLIFCAILLPLILTIIGALLTLIGFGKMEFYDLRPDVGVKVVLSTIIISWLAVLALLFYGAFHEC
ncbi:MAG: hypothetical protein II798_08745 [Lachnospiraceae bacterium]|nr:hypothetical protein [Lachnospiraceae bacterium]